MSEMAAKVILLKFSLWTRYLKKTEETMDSHKETAGNGGVYSARVAQGTSDITKSQSMESPQTPTNSTQSSNHSSERWSGQSVTAIQSKSNDKEDDQPEKDSRWTDTLFYDPRNDDSIKYWLHTTSPSATLRNAARHLLWLAVVHPSLNVDHYKRHNNRRGQTRAELVQQLHPQANFIAHSDLLSIAIAENIRKGYWMIFCQTDEELDLYWKYCVSELDQQSGHLSYSRLECTVNDDFGKGGRIIIVNDDFTDKTTVENLLNACRAVAEKHSLNDGKELFYKPAFYTDIGKYSHKYQNSSPYIFRNRANRYEDNMQYMSGVRTWFTEYYVYNRRFSTVKI